MKLSSNARWIASLEEGTPRSSTRVPYFRKSFVLRGTVKLAQLHVTALGLYECELNGRRIGNDVFAPGWTDYNKRVQYQSYDITSLVRQGENVLGALLGDGWYCGFIGVWDRQMYGARPTLLAQLEITLANGTVQTLATDETWKTTTGPILESDLLMGEYYDARRELGGWSRPRYDDSSWQAVRLAEDPKIEISPCLGPPVRRIEEIKPIEVRAMGTPPDGLLIFDFGQNFSGRVRIRIRVPRGRKVRLRHAEILKPDGHIYTENLRTAKATDYYIGKGGGWQEWEPRFTFHGFRYVEVAWLGAEDKIEVTGVVLHSDTKPTGTFSCSNPLLNQLQHNIVWGQKSNFLEAPTDCPQRDERLGWTGDAQVFIRTAAFNMDVGGFFHKWMRDVRDAQTAKGGIPPAVPAAGFDLEDAGPAWADATIICPWTIYLCYGDRKILEDHYASMQRFFDFTTKHRCHNHIRSHPKADAWGGFGDWLALDGSGKMDGATPKDLIGTAFYAYDAELMARIAVVLGKAKDAAGYRALHGKIVAAFRRRFVTGDGLIVSGTQTSYVLALKFGLLPEARQASAAAVLAKDVETRGYHLATGFVGTPYILDALEQHGHLDVAYKLLEQETFPSWLFPVKNGATTIWERWDGWTPDKGFQDVGMNSFNHYAYGAVGAWMVSRVAGLDVDPENPGYRHILFRPRPGGTLTSAQATLETPQGRVSIAWQKSGRTIKFDLTVPKGARATFDPPPEFGKRRPVGPGRHRFILAPGDSTIHRTTNSPLASFIDDIS
jgi:alpha-L-rhamnosidase